MRLVEAALADSRLGKPKLRYYKSVASPDTGELFYVFDLVGWDDIYRVYVTDGSQTALLRKFAYASLSYPCPTPSASNT